MTDLAFWMIWTPFVFLVVFNFLPSAIAFVDRHPDRHRLAAINLLSLFSGVLWVGLMAWAVGGRRADTRLAAIFGSSRWRRPMACGFVVLLGIELASMAHHLIGA